MRNGLPDFTIVSFVFAPLAVTVIALLCVLWYRVREGRATLRLIGMPGLMLAAAVRRMPDEKNEWGEAMMTDLSQVRGSFSWWRFGLSCARVAMFPPRQRALLQTIINM